MINFKSESDTLLVAEEESDNEGEPDEPFRTPDDGDDASDAEGKPDEQYGRART